MLDGSHRFIVVFDETLLDYGTLTRRALRVASPGVCLVLAAACSSNTPQPRNATPEEAQRLYPELYVQVTRAEPPPYCTPRGTVTGSDDDYIDLRERAAEKRANYVVIDGNRVKPRFMTGWGNEVFGRAFFCPPPPAYPYPPAAHVYPPAAHVYPPPAHPYPTPPPPPTPATDVPAECKPACAMGYSCERGRCVAVCSPACATGEVCGADRVCRAP